MVQVAERLQILLEGEVITKKAAAVAQKAIDKLAEEHEGVELPQTQVEMLVTHLATALTRIERDEKLEAPSEALLQEVHQSEYIDRARREIEWIEQQWGASLPQEEQSFLHIHYVSIFQIIGGDQA